MSDLLRARFEEFRQDTLARTRPAGVTEVRRRVARQHATRAVALVVAATGVAAFAWWPGPGGGGAPTTPPTASPSTAASASPSASAGASPGGPAPSTTRSHSSGGGTGGGGTCTPGGTLSEAAAVAGPDPDTFTLPDELLKQCPQMRLKVTRAVYLAAGPSADTLDLYDSASRTLSAATRTATLPPGALPSGQCYTYLTVTVAGSGSLPHSIPNSVPTLDATGTEFALTDYWAAKRLNLLGVVWGDPVCS